MVRAIILAAGLSRRMGKENKLLLPFGGSTIVETMVKNILKAFESMLPLKAEGQVKRLNEVIVVIGHEAEKVRPVLEKYPLSITLNLDYETGMTSSIQAGVRVAETEETHYMICLSDMVLIQPNEYQFLINQFLNLLKQDKKAIAVPVFNGKKGNPVIFSHFYKNEILNLTYTEGCKPIVQAHPNSVYFIEMPIDSILIDMDNQEDYDKLLT